MLIRAGTPDDAEAAARVHVASWAAASAFEGPSLEQRLELHRRLPASFVAEVDGELVGFVGVGRSNEPDAEGELYTIYVQPSHWGTGVGRELIAAGENRLRELGYGRVVLWVEAGNERAQRFYEAAGWAADGEARTVEFAGELLPVIRYAKQL